MFSFHYLRLQNRTTSTAPVQERQVYKSHPNKNNKRNNNKKREREREAKQCGNPTHNFKA